MPDIPKRQAKAREKPTRSKPNTSTNETLGHLHGLFAEFTEQVNKYVNEVHQLHFIQARVELTEKNLCNTRDYFADQIAKCKCSAPQDWSKVLAGARFVGVRLSEGCMSLLREHRRMSPQQMLAALNTGQYRFRTPTPFREIHGALIKQAWAQRDGDDYVWAGPDPQLELVMVGKVPEERQAS